MSYKVRFPKVVSAAKADTKNCWEMGDALLKYCGPPGTIKGTSLVDVAAELEQMSYPYSPVTLGNLRNVAHQFDEHQRHYELSWGVHQFVGSPKHLEAVLKAWELEGKSSALTADYVKLVLNSQRVVARAESMQAGHPHSNRSRIGIAPIKPHQAREIIDQAELWRRTLDLSAASERLNKDLNDKRLDKADLETLSAMRTSILQAVSCLQAVANRLAKRLGKDIAVVEAVKGVVGKIRPLTAAE